MSYNWSNWITAVGTAALAITTYSYLQETRRLVKLQTQALSAEKQKLEGQHKVLFSVDWSTNILVPGAKRLLDDDALKGDSDTFQKQPGYVDSLDDRVIALVLRNKSSLVAKDIDIDWSVTVYGLQQTFSEEWDIDAWFNQLRHVAVGHRRVQKLRPFQHIAIPVFYIGGAPFIIVELQGISYRMDDNPAVEVVPTTEIMGEVAFREYHQELAEELKGHEDLVTFEGNWFPFDR